MAAHPDDLSIAQLEALISSRKSKLKSLYKQRDLLQKQLQDLEQAIAEAEGTSGTAARRRPANVTPTNVPSVSTMRKDDAHRRSPNDKTLQTHVQQALAANKKGLTLVEIMDAVLRGGYTTGSSNFKNTLYQCLYQNAKAFVLDKQTKRYSLAPK